MYVVSAFFLLSTVGYFVAWLLIIPEHEVCISGTEDHLVFLVVKASASRAKDPGFDFRLRGGDFSGSSHTSDLEIGTRVATLPGAWCHKVSSGTGWPSARIL